MRLRERIAESVADLPVACPERCVHTHAEVAGCWQCVAACPSSAWVLDDEELAIDPSRCDGCGLCVASCPQGALSLDALTVLDGFVGHPVACLSCERSAAAHWELTVPCVHAVSLQQLARLYASGVRGLVLHTDDCTQCSRGAEGVLASRVAALNRLVAQRGLPVLALEVHAPGSDTSPDLAGEPSDKGARLSRRGFLRRILSAAGAKTAAADEVSRWQPPGRYLPQTERGDLALFVPTIDVQRCNGCDACVRICPHAALSLAEDADAYRIDPDACTGCHLCVDICDQKAVSVGECMVAGDVLIPLQTGECRSCGTVFHRPGEEVGEQQLCRVCKRVNHRRNLFQVL